jgi:hypothetical protein
MPVSKMLFSNLKTHLKKLLNLHLSNSMARTFTWNATPNKAAMVSPDIKSP